jgi:serine phosphatase RsbU (regulator of sigma subunit)
MEWICHLGSLSLSALTLTWSGANNPLWILRKEGDTIEEIKADKQPIGKYSDPKPFTTHQLNLSKGDMIYLITDGYQDQFGGEKGKKFKASNLKELIVSIKSETMENQKNLIDEAFETWRGKLGAN